MLEHWLIELIGHVSGLSHAQLKQIEKSLPATKALVDLLNRARPIIEQAEKLYTEAEPRGEGEAAVQTAFPGAVIVRPAAMFAPDDAFLTTILRLLRSLPAYPIFGDGRTRLQPVYVEDVATAIAQILRQSQK